MPRVSLLQDVTDRAGEHQQALGELERNCRIDDDDDDDGGLGGYCRNTFAGVDLSDPPQRFGNLEVVVLRQL